ncbi:hypothetical protein vseg_015235 [Gypsophila vaccaria]
MKQRDRATSTSGIKRKGGYIGGSDSQQYEWGKRDREVRSYEEQRSEEEFEKMCQSEYPEEYMLVPPCFDVPQKCVLENVAATTIAFGDGQTSDKLAGLAICV